MLLTQAQQVQLLSFRVSTDRLVCPHEALVLQRLHIPQQVYLGHQQTPIGRRGQHMVDEPQEATRRQRGRVLTRYRGTLLT